jgi:hypothetical protein
VTIGDGVYFFCVDMKATNGRVYDIDFFMKGPDRDQLEPTEIIIHKVNGEPRYNWYYDESGGIWKKRWATIGSIIWKRTESSALDTKTEDPMPVKEPPVADEHPTEKKATGEEQPTSKSD